MDQLQRLVRIAQRSPRHSLERQRTLTRMMQLMQQSGEILEHRDVWSHEHYEKALLQNWQYFCQNIEQYSPESGTVLQWFNCRLKTLLQLYSAPECRRILFHGK